MLVYGRVCGREQMSYVVIDYASIGEDVGVFLIVF